MNAAMPDASPLTPYVESDLRRLAIWSATGSGKTLLLHVNYLQFLHYTRKANVRDMTDNIVLLTTNERLSEQHAKELKASGIRRRALCERLGWASSERTASAFSTSTNFGTRESRRRSL